MREEYGSLPMSIHDEGFGDMGFDDADFIRDDPNIDVSKKKNVHRINLIMSNLKKILGKFNRRRY